MARVDRLKEAVAGLVVIVVGVMIALAGDEAWSARSDRVREHELLQDLLEEFEANRTALRRDVEGNERVLAAGALWAEEVLGPSSIDADSLSILSRRMTNDNRFDPVTGALRSLVVTGELSLVRNDDLRLALAGWEDRTAQAIRTAQFWDDQRIALVAQILARSPSGDLTRDQRAAVLLARGSVAGQQGHMRDLLRQMDDIIASIRGELER